MNCTPIWHAVTNSGYEKPYSSGENIHLLYMDNNVANVYLSSAGKALAVGTRPLATHQVRMNMPVTSTFLHHSARFCAMVA
jgi:hypothetical protein